MGQAAAISMRPTQLILHLILLKPNIGVGPCGPFWGLNTAGGMTDRGRLYVTPPTEEKGQLWHRGKGPRALVDKAKLAYCEAEGSDSQPRARQEEVQTTSGTAIRSELKITKKINIYIYHLTYPSSCSSLQIFGFRDICVILWSVNVNHFNRTWLLWYTVFPVVSGKTTGCWVSL